MSLVGNIVFEQSASTGTGNFTLVDLLFYVRFSAKFGTGSTNTFYYCIRNRTTLEWEVGIGYMSDANTLVRVTILESSNANAVVDFGAGTKDVICDIPASMQNHLTRIERSSLVREMVGQNSNTGDAYRFQPYIGDRTIRTWIPYGSALTTVAANGITLGFTGSNNAVALGTANLFQTKPRLAHVSAATANAVAGGRHNGLFATTGNDIDRGGFAWTFQGGNADAAPVANSRNFVGLYGTNAFITNKNPSSLLDAVGFGWDTGDTNMQFFCNDDSGTCTKVDLGANFPANTSGVDWYKHELYAPPNASTIGYKLTRMNTGDVVSGSVNSNIPTNTVFLSPQTFIGNGNTALARTYHLGAMYMEIFG